MAAYETVIRGGTVVTASDMVRADIGIAGGRVAALGERLDRGVREIDAGGQLVMPGGVDSHCHIEQPGSSGGTNADTFTSGSISAACGGTTTTISFSPQVRGRGVREAMDSYAVLARKSVIDYCFHIIVNDASDLVIEQELPALIAEGHRSIKVFMTYPSNRMDDSQLLKVFACAKKHGAFVCVHAENHDA
ncbi:MAG: amidohydrolase family protein, partial [Alphaproteobacteria bacterium]|nr:amidohydrolase family protein [Alphaproteobacteria bacterium]